MPRIIENVLRKEEQILCKNCGRTIAYYKNEIESRVYNYMGDHCSESFIICPAEDCKYKIILRCT